MATTFTTEDVDAASERLADKTSDHDWGEILQGLGLDESEHGAFVRLVRLTCQAAMMHELDELKEGQQVDLMVILVAMWTGGFITALQLREEES